MNLRIRQPVEPESSRYNALLGVLSAGDRVVRANAFPLASNPRRTLSAAPRNSMKNLFLNPAARSARQNEGSAR